MSGESDRDDLEERKDEIWSMDEVRGGGDTASTDTTNAAVSEDLSDASESADDSERSDASDTDDTLDEGSPSTEPEVEETPDIESVPDSSGPSDTADISDRSDASVEAGEDPDSKAEGETVRQMALDADDKGLAVRDLHNVNVYLFEGVYHDMRTTFKELDTEYYAAHGEDLSKNKDFFNAVFRAGLRSPQLKEELEIE